VKSQIHYDLRLISRGCDLNPYLEDIYFGIERSPYCSFARNQILSILSRSTFTLMKQTVTFKKNQNLVLSLALMCVLFMQFAFQGHQYDGAAHKANHVCKICIKLSSLDNALAAPDNSLFNSTTAGFTYRFINISLDGLVSHRLIYLRGPPQFFV